MMKLIVFLIVFYPIVLFAQETKTLRVWKGYKNILIKKGVKKEEIPNILTNLNQFNNGVYLVYFGNSILDSIEFTPPHNTVNAFYTGESWLINPFRIYDEKLDGVDAWRDTNCRIRKDILPDGTWMRIVKDSTNFYIESEKNIQNGVFEGKYERWYSNNKPWEISYYKNGYLVDSSFVFDKNEKIHEIKVFFETCNRIKEHIIFDDDRVHYTYYYNYFLNVRIILHKNGFIKNVCKMSNGVPNGTEYIFDENGILIEKKYWNFGLERK